MKNYINWLKSTNELKKKNFILKYETHGEKVTVYYADRKTITIDSTKENIDKLEEKLKNQIISFEKIANDSIGLKLILTFIPGFLLSILGITKTIGELYVLCGIGGLCIAPAIIVAIIVKIKKNDLKKNKLLLENLEKINKKFNENPEKVYEILKTKKITLEETKEDNNIKLNDTDLFTKRKISSLVETINKESEFNTIKRNRPKMKIRKK